MACDPQTMPQDAGCFGCIPPEHHAAVQSYLLARIRGGSMDVDEIMRDTACMNCIPPGVLPQVRSYLLCQLANTGGGSIPPFPECDADAAAFIAAAGITDDVQIGAICVLVRDLKAYPAVGTKYWDREYLIYPFVGGNATAHAVNLKNPGTNDLVFVGAGFTHSALGVKSDASAGTYATTNYLVPSQNSFRASWYLDLDTAVALNRWYFGTHNATSVGSYRNVAQRFISRINDVNVVQVATPAPLTGLRIVQRSDAANKKTAYGVLNWENVAVASGAVPDRHILIWALNQGGVAPVGLAVSLSDCRLSSICFGAPLNATDNVEHLEYKGIWDAFHTTLGRGHP